VKAVRIISPGYEDPGVELDAKELVRITISPRGKKVLKRTAIGAGVLGTAVVAVAINRSTKAHMVARTVANAANEVAEEVTA
jgi:hypothetical protein